MSDDNEDRKYRGEQILLLIAHLVRVLDSLKKIGFSRVLFSLFIHFDILYVCQNRGMISNEEWIKIAMNLDDCSVKSFAHFVKQYRENYFWYSGSNRKLAEIGNELTQKLVKVALRFESLSKVRFNHLFNVRQGGRFLNDPSRFTGHKIFLSMTDVVLLTLQSSKSLILHSLHVLIFHAPFILL